MTHYTLVDQKTDLPNATRRYKSASIRGKRPKVHRQLLVVHKRTRKPRHQTLEPTEPDCHVQNRSLWLRLILILILIQLNALHGLICLWPCVVPRTSTITRLRDDRARHSIAQTPTKSAIFADCPTLCELDAVLRESRRRKSAITVHDFLRASNSHSLVPTTIPVVLVIGIVKFKIPREDFARWRDRIQGNDRT